MSGTTEAKSPKKDLGATDVGSDSYMTSLTRRLGVLEKKLTGKGQLKEKQPPLYPTVNVSPLSLSLSSAYLV